MTQMKQYAQYIYKDNEWRILGATSSSPFSKLTGTQANPIYLTSLESGQYLIQGYIKIDATHDFAIPVNCAYDTNCIIGYELFTICKNTDVGTMSVSCNYGNFLYDITGDNPVLLEAQMYASTDDIPTKTSDLTNDSGFITSDSDEKVKQIANTTSNSALRVLFAPNVLDTDYTGNVNKSSNFTYNPSTKALATGGTVDGYKLAAASAKGVDTSIAAASASANLPTSQAVANFVEGKGYTSNTGTITGITMNGVSKGTSGIVNLGTIATTDTKNTAGSTDSSSKLFLIGATSQAANPQTYSQDTAYVGTDGHLYSNSKQVVNLSDSQALTNKTYNGYTLNAASAKAVDTSISEGTSSTNLPTSAAVANYAPIKIKTGTNGAATITNKIDMKSDAYDGVEFLTRADKDANNFSYSGISSASNDEQTSENSLYSYIKKGSATKSATISTYVSDNGTSLDNSEIRLGADDIYAAAGNNLNISATSLNIGDQYNNTSLDSHIYGDNYGDLGQHGDLQVEGDFWAYATDTSTGDVNTISHGQGNISLTATNQSNSTISNLSLNPDGTASLSANSLTLSGVITPTSNTMAANKQYVDNAVASITPTIPNATSTTVGGIKMRLDIDTNTLYITNDGSNA